MAGGKGTLHLVAGAWDGARGPVDSLTGVFMSTIALQAGAQLRLPGLAGRNVFLYVVRGAVHVGDTEAPAFPLVDLSADGDELVLSSEHGALLAYGHAEPIGEPVYSHGPFVMNTREEIIAAISDYQAGKFGAPA